MDVGGTLEVEVLVGTADWLHPAKIRNIVITIHRRLIMILPIPAVKMLNQPDYSHSNPGAFSLRIE